MRIEKKSKKALLKKILLGLVALVLVLLLWQYKLVYYGISQAKGQLSIIWNARPVEEVLNDPAYPDSTKAKLKLVEEIRQFAFDSLGLNRNENYTTFFDQKGKPILWVVTGAEPYALKAKEWEFPVLGAVSYKGFFDHNMAVEEEKLLLNDGLDTEIGEVEGWSTLGWFKDPVLSNMLERPVGGLANVIIHELTHGTLYVKDNVQYNENLASFVGDKGAMMFLEQKYGKNSEEYKDYVKRKEIWNNYSKLVLAKADSLEKLYNSFGPGLSDDDKIEKKKAYLNAVIKEFKDFLIYFKKRDPEFYNDLDSINNTYFMSFRRYRQDQNTFEKEFQEKFNGDFKRYFQYLKKTYPSL